MSRRELRDWARCLRIGARVACDEVVDALRPYDDPAIGDRAEAERQAVFRAIDTQCAELLAQIPPEPPDPDYDF